MGIAIHNLSATSGEGHGAATSGDLAAAVRQNALGLLGTSVQLADLVSNYSPGTEWLLYSDTTVT